MHISTIKHLIWGSVRITTYWSKTFVYSHAEIIISMKKFIQIMKGYCSWETIRHKCRSLTVCYRKELFRFICTGASVILLLFRYKHAIQCLQQISNNRLLSHIECSSLFEELFLLHCVLENTRGEMTWSRLFNPVFDDG